MMLGFSGQFNPFTSGVKECVLAGRECPTQTHPELPPLLLEIRSSAGLCLQKGFQHPQLAGEMVSVQ